MAGICGHRGAAYPAPFADVGRSEPVRKDREVRFLDPPTDGEMGLSGGAYACDLRRKYSLRTARHAVGCFGACVLFDAGDFKYILRDRRADLGRNKRKHEHRHRFRTLRNTERARAVHLYKVHRGMVRFFAGDIYGLCPTYNRSDLGAVPASDPAGRDVRSLGNDRAAHNLGLAVGRAPCIRAIGDA